jgi:hypothetical protein
MILEKVFFIKQPSIDKIHRHHVHKTFDRVDTKADRQPLTKI